MRFPRRRPVATMSSAPVEGPPMRSTASHLPISSRAMGWKISSNTASPIFFDRAEADMRHGLGLLMHAGRHRIARLGAGDVGHRPAIARRVMEPDRLGVAGDRMRRKLAVRPGGKFRIVDDQAAYRREGQDLD